MSARGIDFLDDWIKQHVTPTHTDDDPQLAKVLAARCILDAEGRGISKEEMDPEWGSVEDLIREAMENLAEPGNPVD